MQAEVKQIWSCVLEAAKERFGEQTCETWFCPIRAQEFTEDTLVLEVPNKFFQTWIKEHYLGLIKEVLKSFAQEKEVGVEFVIQARSQTPKDSTPQAKSKRWFFRPAAKTQLQQEQLELNPRFTFENFVVGPSNRFSHAAAQAVAESPARSYNPLFIYGRVGLGKTHLMQAIGMHILKNNPSLKVTYISSEKFTNQLISAIQHRTTTPFRQKYRTVDILLIDDIHFIAGKEATQEEFFHTFNTLYDAHKQIVLSSDRSPKDISTLEERLVSRFEWGLVCDVQAPDLETRIAILKKKAEQNSIQVPDEVVFFIADKIKMNIRELEGALIRVAAYSSLTNQAITLELTHSTLKDMLREEKRLSVDEIQRGVANYFDLRVLDMKAKRRNRAVVYPRQIAMYLTRRLTEYSLPEIGEYFGGRDHTTILHACEKIEKELKKDIKLKGVLDKIVTGIKNK